MSLKTKTMSILLAAELGGACLLIAVIVWAVRQNAVQRVSAQPLAEASPSATPFLAPTAFLPSPSATATPREPLAIEFLPPIPIATQTPLPSLTPQIDSPLPGILPITSGPLNSLQQAYLELIARKYLAPTTADGIRLARELNYIGRDGHPSNICGPLSIAILREAGIISPETPLEKFWLLNPEDKTARQLLARTFPPERFDDLRTQIPLNKFDWSASPLLPGDFLYIYAGQGGNFEHMLVVSRVDPQKRAYAVTNYATPEGFVIQEVLLYDPSDPSVGIFHTWTQHVYALLGSTGFGGFEVWRLRSAAP
jgi:hypothetical protein